MLRYLLIVVLFCLVQQANAQSILFPAEQQPMTLRVGYWLPDWSEPFADSVIKKHQVEPKISLPALPSTLPAGMRATDYIGRDGLPGDPLPAIHYERPRSFYLEKIQELRDSVLFERTPIKKK